MYNDPTEIIKNGPLHKLNEMLSDAFGQMIDFCTHYLFLIVALATIAKVVIGLIFGKPPGLVTILIGVISSCMAIASGVFFW